MSPKPVETETRPADTDSAFDLDVRLLEIADPAGLVNVTDDGCTSTCGACVSGAV
ncbi:FxLD family lantipeptide [Actinomadura sp. LD22]|jgi:FxLD family lantipeptide|uniref:FxLD family lantipeptide n=1 Tax=Actinomadura physcomitrii TaxID=2650748 RepID=A0A6I4MJ18_9ACTN|nr:FxLD family lanthipeptide [Actinomadura physcomitrii]MWA04615.1 FxLD family lantipeptide [Actinomadura physcomitrii]